MDDPRIGTKLGNYRIESLIGKGGMGVVYLAQHLLMATRKAALKVMAPKYADDPEFRDRFLRESDLAGALEHPSIIPVFDADEDDGVLFCAMRYVDGVDLKEELARRTRLQPEFAFAVLGDVASALDFAHAHGLVHRDVKPGNVMLETSGRARRVFLTDFGLVKRMRSDSTGTRQGLFLGTLDYAAPEQLQGGPVDGRTDEYALAAVLVECLTGEPPFSGETDAQIVGAHLAQSPPSVSEREPELSAALDAVVARGMAKEKEGRFATCTELVDAARQAMAEPRRERHFTGATWAVPPPPLAVREAPLRQPSPASPVPPGPTVAATRMPAAPDAATPAAASGWIPSKTPRRGRDPIAVVIAALIVASAVGFLVAASQATKGSGRPSPNASSGSLTSNASTPPVATDPFLDHDTAQGTKPTPGEVVLGGRTFSRSIHYRRPGTGTIATSYELGGRWTRFKAWVGIQPDSSDALGTCRNDTAFGTRVSRCSWTERGASPARSPAMRPSRSRLS